MFMLAPRRRPAPGFAFDRRTDRQRHVAALGLPVAVLCAAGFLGLEPALGRWLPAPLSDAVALLVVGVPLGVWWAVADRNAGAAAAWKTGGLFAFASAVLYLWIFGGGWV